jgi:hypothetical protein
MIWGREIDVPPEMSRVERARRAKKKRTIPIVLPSGGEAAPSESPSGEAAPWLHTKGKVSVLRDSAYIRPAASRERHGGLGGNPSCYSNRRPQPGELDLLTSKTDFS